MIDKKSYKLYTLAISVVSIPIASAAVINQFYENLMPNWAVGLGGLAGLLTLACVAALGRRIKSSISMSHLKSTLDMITTPIVIADRKHKVCYKNPSFYDLRHDPLEQDGQNIQSLFQEALFNGFHTDAESLESTNAMLTNLISPLHCHYDKHDQKFRLLFKPIIYQGQRLGTLIEFHAISDNELNNIKAKTISNLQNKLFEATEIQKESQLDYFIRRCQQPILVVTQDQKIEQINSAMLQLLKVDSEVNWKGHDIKEVLEHQSIHLQTLMEQAFKSEQKARFLEEQSPSSDWCVTPLRQDKKIIGYIIEAQSPSKQEILSLNTHLEDLRSEYKVCQKELAQFVNTIQDLDLYHQKEGTSYTYSSNQSYKHPLLKKGAESIDQLAKIVQKSAKEADEIRDLLRHEKQNPKAISNQVNVLGQALLRNLDQFRRDYLALKNHQQESNRIVNEQKGIVQGFAQIVETGFARTKTCREKTLSGFEMVTMIVQSLHQFECQLAAMLKILEKTQSKIGKAKLGQNISSTLDTFMQALTEQIRQANLHCKKNKNRLNVLIPNYASHHLDLGHLQTQWQSGIELLEIQESTLAEWRVYHKQEDSHQGHLETRLEEMFALTEKLLRKSQLGENTEEITNTPYQNFQEIVIKSGLPNFDENIAKQN